MRLKPSRVFPVVLAGLLALLLVAPASQAARSRRHAVRHHATRQHAARQSARVLRPTHGSGTSATGYDISYPQCTKSYPSGQAFGVVGVNGGLANNANQCLSSELAWAAGSPGLTKPAQPPASLYLNTADPGNGVADWPTSGSSARYGGCDGSWSTACSYLYGEQRAAYSYGLVTPYASTVNPASVPWWLDIETVNSWATPSSNPNWAALNIATIQGFVDGLVGAGATRTIGFYSTASQWQSITGLTATTSPTDFPTTEPDWVAGARNYSQAQSNCSASFTGGAVALAQYPSGGYDGDFACPAP